MPKQFMINCPSTMVGKMTVLEVPDRPIAHKELVNFTGHMISIFTSLTKRDVQDIVKHIMAVNDRAYLLDALMPYKGKSPYEHSFDRDEFEDAVKRATARSQEEQSNRSTEMTESDFEDLCIDDIDE